MGWIAVLVGGFGVVVLAGASWFLWKAWQSGAGRPRDDWAPIEAAFGRKFLATTARSDRHWVTAPSGERHLVEVTKQSHAYEISVDDKPVHQSTTQDDARSEAKRLVTLIAAGQFLDGGPMPTSA